MSARSKARKRALDVLFESELRGTNPVATLADWLARADPPIPEYAVALVQGVVDHQIEIDELLGRYAEGWTVARMPTVDRIVLRLAAYELLWCPDVPGAVAISEAVALAGSLSTDESSAFVNGLLAGVLELEPTRSATPDGAATGVAGPSGRDLDGAPDGSGEPPSSDRGLDGAPGVGGQDAPADQLLGEQARALVVDHGE